MFLGEGAGCGSDDSDDDDIAELTTPAPREGVEGGTKPGDALVPHLNPPISIWTLDWGPEYMNCSEWSDIFLLVQGVVSDWPEGYQFRGADLFMVGKSACPPLCRKG